MTTDVAVIEDVPVRHFNPNDHIMQIPNKGGKSDYLPVQWRLVWFRELCPQGTIESELVLLELDRETEEEAYVWNSETRRSEKVIKRANGLAVFKAVVTDGKGGKAEAYKSEKAASFGDFIEKANTGAVGRALAMLGYGTQFAEMELSEEERIVDAPVERKPAKSYQERKPFVEGSVSVKEEPKPVLQTVPAQPQAQDVEPEAPSTGNMILDDMPPSGGQLENIRQLALHLGARIKKPATFAEAAHLLDSMQSEWDQMKSRGRAS